MTETLYPYIIFLPRSRKQKVLRAIFDSRVPIDILTFSIDKGITEKIYQRDLISKLPYSNKTIIERLQALTELGILEEHMEKSTIKTRAVWLKYYLLSDFGRWFAILLLEEKSLTKNEKVGIVNTAFTSYLRWIRKLADDLGIRKEELARIFNEEIGV